MGHLQRSRVRLSVELERAVYRPGDELSGRVHLHVREPVTFRALRLQVVGRESIDLSIQRGTGTALVKEDIEYMNTWVTFTGPCPRSPCKTKLTYEPGCYSFNFAVTLALKLPPSFAVDSNTGHVVLAYMARATLDIPGGLDAVSEVTFRVASVAPLAQHRCRQERCCPAAAACRTAQAYRYDWLGVLWARRRGESVQVCAEAAPGIIALQRGGDCSAATSATAPSSPPPTCEVHLSITNNTRKALTGLRVELVNLVRIEYDLHASLRTVVVAAADLPDILISPKERQAVRVPLLVSAAGFRAEMTDSAGLPVPSLATPAVTSSYVLRVRFPRNRIERNICYTGLVDLVEAVTATEGVPAVPTIFTRTVVAAREMRYVSTPARVTQLPRGVSFSDAYPTEHAPYLRRAASTGFTAGAGAVGSGGTEEETAPPTANERDVVDASSPSPSLVASAAAVVTLW